MADETQTEQPITDINAMDSSAGAPQDAGQEKDIVEDGATDAPSRWRRTVFIYVTVAVAYVSIMVLAFKGSGKIAELAADGFVSYIMVTAVAYVAAYSIDRSEIFTKMGERFGRRYNHRDE